ncbi:MAG: hypothetical protein ACLPGW_09735 [Roseiarcus sp.]
MTFASAPLAVGAGVAAAAPTVAVSEFAAAPPVLPASREKN